ncbi:auxin-responsive protein IAA20-like isoform X2 [Mercurialis annua]|uniref:auxin-responsive protein IAA20-like isoform X2 n=1 Tax=Mercurialis annua TaxID=3986 RepID=UPI00215E2629|nr:auxin-responsive protein IAA20-like isoform X2 [Mercurialis annua]
MELQLGLALPTNTVFGFDLNSYVYQPKQVSGSGQLNHHRRRRASCFQLDSFTEPCSSSTDESISSNKNKNSKRSRDDIPLTLPLLLWNNPPNDDDDQDSQHNGSSFAFNKNEEEDSDDGIVGWPPIKHRRKRIRRMENYRTVENGCADCYGRQSNYVKVKMDGVAIARKIDLTLFTSFQQLKQTLFAMFGICQENSTTFKLAYQDREGDWLLADDISWRSFVRSVQRLKLMKNNNG